MAGLYAAPCEPSRPLLEPPVMAMCREMDMMGFWLAQAEAGLKKLG